MTNVTASKALIRVLGSVQEDLDRGISDLVPEWLFKVPQELFDNFVATEYRISIEELDTFGLLRNHAYGVLVASEGVGDPEVAAAWRDLQATVFKADRLIDAAELSVTHNRRKAPSFMAGI